MFQLQLQKFLESHAIKDDTPELQPTERRIVELPLDIHFDIIGFLSNIRNAGTIVNCALVCRRWLPFCQFKLYHGVPLNFRRQWLSFKRLVLQPSSNIGRHFGGMRELYLRPWDEQYFDKQKKQPRIGWGKGQERPWAHLVLMQCAAQLDQLIHIYFYEIDWTCAQDLALSCGGNYRSLSKLDLVGCTFTNVGQLGLLVTAFPALDDLILMAIKLRSSKPLRVSRIPKAAHSLKRLELKCLQDVMAALAPWLAHSQLVRNLVYLDWRWQYSENDWKAVSEAIDGPCLQELYLYERRDWKVDLARFTCLKTLDLRDSLMTDQGWNLLTQALSSISSSRLEELRISHSNSEPLSLDSVLAAFAHLKTVNDTFAHPQYTQLRYVKLEYEISILIQAIPIASNNSALPSRDVTAPIAGSSSQPDPSNELVNPQSDPLNQNLFHPQHPFRLYAEPLVRRRIQEELKQLVTRGILDLEVIVWPKQSPDVIPKLEDSAAASTPPANG